MPGGTSRLQVAAVAGALVLGVGLGAAAFSVLDEEGKTVVREVEVPAAEPAARDLGATSVAEVYDRASKAVIELQATSSSGSGAPTSRAQGSGFVLDRNGHIVTNQHVVDGADRLSVSFWNGVSRPATLVGADASTDLAVLRVEGKPSFFHPLMLADSSEVRVGDPVLALGSPFGLEGTLTSGIVSGLNRRMEAPNRFTISGTIQTDAAINHGNSGGPLLDLRGRVIGVNAQIESESGGSDGVGFAIPSNTVRRIVRELISTGRAVHAYLGVVMTPVAAGVAVTEVQPDSPAEKAGIRAATRYELVDGRQVPAGGDVILEFDGRPVRTPADMQAAVDSRRPGDAARLTLSRNGKRITLEVTLGERE